MVTLSPGRRDSGGGDAPAGLGAEGEGAHGRVLEVRRGRGRKLGVLGDRRPAAGVRRVVEGGTSEALVDGRLQANLCCDGFDSSPDELYLST